MTVVFWVVSGILALGFGIWLGLPGRYEQTPEEIEQIMAQGGGRRRKTKKAFTPLAWLQRKVNVRSGGRGGRRGFNLDSPDDR